MADFEAAYSRVIREEGGYKLTNIKGDNGGQTYAGIARKFHPKWFGWKYIDRDETPPTQLVRDFYLITFWQPIRGNDIADQRIAEAIYSASVNAEAARKLAQLAAKVEPDGKFGPRTILGINASNAELYLLRFFAALVVRYVAIVRKNRSQSKFLLGWIARATKVLP